MPTVGLEENPNTVSESFGERAREDLTETSDLPDVQLSDAPSFPSCKSDKNSVSKSHSSGDDGLLDPHRFKSAFVQAVEELRMRRTIDVENDCRIKKLEDNNHDLKKKLEDEKTSIGTLIEGHSQIEQNLRSDYGEKVKQTENEKVKTRILGENWDYELKSLKDKIRALHLVKYSLEKKVTEQKRQLQLQSSSRDGYLSQMNDLDEKFSAVLKQADFISEQMEKLEANVKASKDLHLKLQYVNEHRTCELEAYKTRLEDCRAELMEETCIKVVEVHAPECTEVVTTRTKAIDQELKMQTELNKQLQDQLSSLRKEHQDILRQLKDAHSLIEKHAQSLTTATKSEEELRKETTSLHETIDHLTQEVDQSHKAEQSIKEELSKENEYWSAKYSDIDARLKSLQEDYTTQQENHYKELETKANQLTTVEKFVVELKDEVAQLQDQLITARGEVSSLKEQVHRITIDAQRTLSQHSVQISSTTGESSYSPKVTNRHTPLTSVPNLGSSPEVTNRRTPLTLVGSSPDLLGSPTTPLNTSNKVIKGESAQLTRIEEIPVSINTQESGQNSELNNSLTQIKSSQGAKRPNIDEETEYPAKKICADPVKPEDEQIVAYINNRQVTQLELSSGNMCNEEASKNIQPSITSHQMSVPADLQNTLPCYDQPREMCTNVMKTDSPQAVETTQEPPSTNEKLSPTSNQMIESQTMSTTCGQLHSDVAQKEPGPLPTVVPILFSDDDDGAGEDSLWNTQLNMQIDKVQTVLKLDKLRRPKKNS